LLFIRVNDGGRRVSLTVVEFYQTTGRHNILYINLHSHNHQKFKYEMKMNNRKTIITRYVEKVPILLKCGARHWVNAVRRCGEM